MSLHVCAIQEAAKVLRAAESFQLTESTPQKLRNALSNLISSARALVHREQRSKASCLIRVQRVHNALRHHGRIGGVLLPATTKPCLLSPPPPQTTPRPRLLKAQKCYVCKVAFNELHPFYDCMCKACGDLNYAKRLQTCILTGQRAIVTGGRIKIGFQIALKLLRAGATVVVTTRFPNDAQTRYRQEADWKRWQDRLTIVRLDLLDVKGVLAFCEQLKQQPLHMLINNAAQTIAKPAFFYQPLLLGGEKTPLSVLAVTSPSDRQLAPFFPSDRRDENGIQVDLRPKNTWTTPLQETPFDELLHVTAINYLAPYILMRQLHPALVRATPRAFVVNVSAMEGDFYIHKTGFHAHTNAAKASLNMITRTVARPWAKEGVYVTSVDTGWVTNEYPIDKYDTPNKYHPPLDDIDGAARVLDPIFNAGDEPLCGVLLKDYKTRPW